MAGQVAQNTTDVKTILRHLHRLVTYGPWDLEIASAMARYGYDAAKWAEGQGVLAELVTCEPVVEACLAMAVRWYDEAAAAARHALAASPHLLAKLGVGEAALE